MTLRCIRWSRPPRWRPVSMPHVARASRALTRWDGNVAAVARSGAVARHGRRRVADPPAAVGGVPVPLPARQRVAGAGGGPARATPGAVTPRTRDARPRGARTMGARGARPSGGGARAGGRAVAAGRDRPASRADERVRGGGGAARAHGEGHPLGAAPRGHRDGPRRLRRRRQRPPGARRRRARGGGAALRAR